MLHQISITLLMSIVSQVGPLSVSSGRLSDGTAVVLIPDVSTAAVSEGWFILEGTQAGGGKILLIARGRPGSPVVPARPSPGRPTVPPLNPDPPVQWPALPQDTRPRAPLAPLAGQWWLLSPPQIPIAR